MRLRLGRLFALIALAPASLQAGAGGQSTVQKHLEVVDPRTSAGAGQGATVLLASDGSKTSLIGRLGWAASSWSLGLTLETPVEKPDEQEATLADESGLEASTVATVSVSRLLHVSASQADTAVCEEFNRLTRDAYRDSLHLKRPSAKVTPDSCRPENVSQLGDFGDNALRQSRTQALQATCDELTKLGLYPPTLNEKDWVRSLAGDSQAPAYLPESCGSVDPTEVEAQLGRLEAATSEFRSVAGGSKRAVDDLLETLKTNHDAAMKAWDATPVDQRTPAVRSSLVASAEKIGSLEVQAKSEAAKDPRMWFELELRKRLLDECSKADGVPLEKLVDVTDQSSSDKGCEVAPFQKMVASSGLSRRDKSRLALEAQEKLLPRVLYATAAVSGGNETFEYRKSGTLEATKESRINRSFTGAVTRASGIDGWTLGHSWRKVYEGGKKVQLCEPVPGATSTVCTSAVLTAPTRDQEDQSLSFLEYRRYASVHLAIGGRIFYRHDPDQWGVRSTWFFLTKGTVGLDGGIDLGYDGKTEVVSSEGKKTESGGFVARLFVGRKFELFPL